MNNFNRRDFIKLMGISAAAVATPSLIKTAHGNALPRVVVAGSGFAGSTVAKHLRLWSSNAIDVTVVDPETSHISCVMSNLVVNEQLQMSDITFEHALLSQKYGVNFIQGSVLDVNEINNPDTGKPEKIVSLQDGPDLICDFVILAPGISFEAIDNWDPLIAPHTWQAGIQTEILRTKLREIPAGGTFVMTVPRAPYRCPPGPYERACVVADIMKNKGGGRVIVLGANPNIIVEEHMFSTAFNGIYGDIVEYHSNVDVVSVSGSSITTTTAGNFDADVLNVIPNQRAGKIISDLGLNNVSGRWAEVDPMSYESTNPTKSNIFIIGDSNGTKQPKSGHMANSQAKVCADAIIRKIANTPLDSLERLSNLTTNSACYSPITSTTATWLTAAYAFDIKETDNAKKMKPISASLGEAELHNVDHYKDMFSWAGNLFENTFM